MVAGGQGTQRTAPTTDLASVRRERMRELADVAAGKGLEIGPLYSPVVAKSEADVRYVDVQLTPELRAYYATHPGVPIDDIVDVDHALIENGATRGLGEAVAPSAPFDWVIASHVIEHVPDVVGWMREISSVLADGGRLVLAVPDRRFTFDVLRPPTTVGQLIEAYEREDVRPTSRAIFDHFSATVDAPAADLWRGWMPTDDHVIHGVDYAWEQVGAARREQTYVDCHVWLFTPGSFVTQLRTLAHLGLIDLTIDRVVPTAEDELEFYAVLRRVRRDPDPERVRASVLQGFPDEEAVRDLDGTQSWNAQGDDSAGSNDFAVSDRERRVILAKRRAFEAVRGAARRARGG